ncbi:hypothetical protein EHQ12_10490 [Leptospira gomenensis]|uniref:Uncharacterized protein n=1 Tax=Leptospira gomenensis TaxID=2484974 RepID=A0A5F1YF30_9LEPT|nr:hypothetical protein [Leptospira gomenensis]TGK36451.1 hypothetical protein EHQ17_04055 [Leptospira gomenensis]TGK38280.1 hypothetical protein EHQ12_10490 [Leptospira gomenensis]TGK46021.1 hypothetical protein EHQ07_07615 [Leptospira gomenensis]TGK65285.1 hypothetical protein EHQ13_05420 [Leptospira gomenensis]
MSALVLFTGAFLNGCVFLQSVSITQQPPAGQRNVPIETEVSKFVILAFNFNNDFLNEIPEKLSAQCPKGKISGLMTKYEKVSYVFAHRMVVKAKGYCVQE